LLERRQKVAHGARLNGDEIEWFKELRRITSSLGARWIGRRSWRGSRTQDRRQPDFQIPSSPGTIRSLLACVAWSRRTTEILRSFRDDRRSSRTPAVAEPELAEARVSTRFSLGWAREKRDGTRVLLRRWRSAL
jgi:hypothetical protein